LLESFLAMQGRSCMVVGGGGVARGKEKDGERKVGGGEEKKN
jgi:hypothetical protein